MTSSSSTSRVSLALLLLSSSSTANAVSTSQAANPVVVNSNGQVGAPPASTSLRTSSLRTLTTARTTMSSSVPPGQTPDPSISSSVAPGSAPSSVAVDTSSPPPAAAPAPSSSSSIPPAATPPPSSSTPPPAAPSTTSDSSTILSSSTIISTTSTSLLPTTTSTSDIPTTTSTSSTSTSDLITSTSTSLLPTSTTSSSILTTSTSALPAATTSAAPIVAPSSVNYGHVAAGIIGTCAGLAIVGVIAFVLRRRYIARKARDGPPSSDDPFFNNHPFAAPQHLTQPMSNRASMLGPSVAPFFRRPRPQSVISDITDLTTPSSTLPAYDEKAAVVRERERETPSPVSPVSTDEKTYFQETRPQVQSSPPRRAQMPSTQQVPNWQVQTTPTHARNPIPSPAAQSERRRIVFANGVPPITHTTYNHARSPQSQQQSSPQSQPRMQQPRRSEDARRQQHAPMMQMQTPQHRYNTSPYHANQSVRPSPSSVYTPYTTTPQGQGQGQGQLRYMEVTPPVPQRAQGHEYVYRNGQSPQRYGHERSGSRFSENL